MSSSHVWYAAYGSNLSEQRFLTYIFGGKPEFGKKVQKGCTDKTPPSGDDVLRVPYALYFGLPSRRTETKNWGRGGVAFLTVERSPVQQPMVLCRIWKITREQYDEVRVQEGQKWYNHEMELGEKDGIPLVTLTTKRSDIKIQRPSADYLMTIALGLREACDFREDEFASYLIVSPGIASQISEFELRRIYADGVASV